MTRFILPLILLCTLPAMAGNLTRYFSALPDLPLAEGISEVQGSAVRFDQPEGRVIVLQASGSAKAETVKSFYHKTLPALGWQEKADNRFTRNGEVLLLETKQSAGGLRVNVLVRPE